MSSASESAGTSGNDLIKVFESLSHPLRIKIMGILFQNRQYVSELARTVNISRPLLYMHLRKLEAANLIRGNHEISEDGKAMKYYEISNFDLHITPELLSEIAQSVTITQESKT
ncbi:ArsR/SmtB family transcription factor [Ruminiclostridium cellobioparum]|jgi:predicted transcriptional regulator|uniref:ArsR/SmtB family transcription factor n=1 Tax=Ruminiclostridium cellobioparum TaxID=29355 RepID=UPI000480E17C|nr:winged helix-turn-helix domain-containing protein [Ruminiclostridium cellobioparum]